MKTHIYIDASNLLVEFGKHVDLPVRADEPTKLLAHFIYELVTRSIAFQRIDIQRVYWFGSHRCSTEEALKYKKIIRSENFEPVLLKRPQGKGEKGVDIAMATEMMSCAFNNQCDISVIVVGDEDYAPVVREIRRTGHEVIMMFFEIPSSDILRIECDRFIPLDELALSVGIWIKQEMEKESKT
ncbi:NYN domain-containing protein [Thermodesulfobacteriota bacterium]